MVPLLRTQWIFQPGVCQKAPEDRRVCLPLLPDSGYRRKGLTRSMGLWVAPSSLPRSEEDSLSGLDRVL